MLENNEQAQLDAQTNQEEVNENIEAKSLDQQLKEQKEHYLRIVADYENRMKRTTQDSMNAISSTIERLLSDIIPLMKDLNLAASTVDGVAKTGLDLIEKNMKSILGKYGIKEIEVQIGQEFDPNLHQALSAMKKEDYQEGKIIEIIQNGYTFNKKVIIPALVIVSE